MSAIAAIEIHRSAFPDAVSKSIVASLRARALTPRILYEGLRQTQKWLALHEQCSPAQIDTHVQNTYAGIFQETASLVRATTVEVIGLGCGGGTKDAALIEQLVGAGKQVFYTPVDVSVGMVLTARTAALKRLSSERIRGVVWDLADGTGLDEVLISGKPTGFHVDRVVTAFGLLPTFEPETLLPVLASFVADGAVVLLSANLAPGPNYDAGVKQVLAGYDNELTRDWLWSALKDLDIWPEDGELSFKIEDGTAGTGLKRIVARLGFRRAKAIRVYQEETRFEMGESLRVFFSYRHTPQLVRQLLAGYKMTVAAERLSVSGEEGVFRI